MNEAPCCFCPCHCEPCADAAELRHWQRYSFAFTHKQRAREWPGAPIGDEAAAFFACTVCVRHHCGVLRARPAWRQDVEPTPWVGEDGG